MFRSTGNPDLIAYSRDESGNSLPVDLGPWLLQPQNPILIGDGSTNPIMAEISERGYALIGERKPE